MLILIFFSRILFSFITSLIHSNNYIFTVRINSITFSSIKNKSKSKRNKVNERKLEIKFCEGNRKTSEQNSFEEEEEEATAFVQKFYDCRICQLFRGSFFIPAMSHFHVDFSLVYFLTVKWPLNLQLHITSIIILD